MTVLYPIYNVNIQQTNKHKKKHIQKEIAKRMTALSVLYIVYISLQQQSKNYIQKNKKSFSIFVKQ